MWFKDLLTLGNVPTAHYMLTHSTLKFSTLSGTINSSIKIIFIKLEFKRGLSGQKTLFIVFYIVWNNMKQISVNFVGHCSELPFEEVLRDIRALLTSKIKQV